MNLSKKFRFVMLILALVFASTGTWMRVDQVNAAPVCAGFESLTLGTSYAVGAMFTDSGADITARPFIWSSGIATSTGFSQVENGGLAGGSGNELEVNNINLEFDFGGPVSDVSLNFGEYGGNLNIEVNGDFVNFNNFADINGTTIGGVTVTVVNGLGNDKGQLELGGVVKSFTIGGQELWIDDLCWNAMGPPIFLPIILNGTPSGMD